MGKDNTPSPTATVIRVLGIDPGFANWGAATATLELEPDQTEPPIIRVQSVHLLSTERSKVKTVRRNSDDFSRAVALSRFLQDLMDEHQPTLVFSEIPSGAQSANAAKGFGIAIGLLAAHAPHLIQVMPSEVKEALTGSKTASKQDMISTAVKLFPKAVGWKRHNRKLVAAAEHQADAVGSVHAGVLTPEFEQLKRLLL